MFKYRLRQMEALLQRLAQARQAPPPVAPRRLQTPQDVIDLLQGQVEAIRHDGCAGPLARARAIACLAAIARRAIETGTLAQRLEMLEAVLQKRKGTGPS
jgi:hypothetical protein